MSSSSDSNTTTTIATTSAATDEEINIKYENHGSIKRENSGNDRIQQRQQQQQQIAQRHLSNQELQAASEAVEQEINAVTALKRLSIGNNLSYDPDLPFGDNEYNSEFNHNQQQQQQQQQQHNNNNSSSSSSINITINNNTTATNNNNNNNNNIWDDVLSSNSSSGRSVRARSTSGGSIGSSIGGNNNKSRRNSLMSLTAITGTSSIVGEYGGGSGSPAEVSAKILTDNEIVDEDTIIDTDKLLWVPADAHPEIAPERFKQHIQKTVHEITEKLQTKNSIRRSSSLMESHNVNDDDDDDLGNEEQKQQDDEQPEQQLSKQCWRNDEAKQPSIRDLTKELEKLSEMAGLAATDAVTLARTLSSSSLGYTTIEKEAYDLTPLNKSTSAIFGKSSSIHNYPDKKDDDTPVLSPKSGSQLKRSRWTSYRKNSSLSGSSLKSSHNDITSSSVKTSPILKDENDSGKLDEVSNNTKDLKFKVLNDTKSESHPYQTTKVASTENNRQPLANLQDQQKHQRQSQPQSQPQPQQPQQRPQQFGKADLSAQNFGYPQQQSQRKPQQRHPPYHQPNQYQRRPSHPSAQIIHQGNNDGSSSAQIQQQQQQHQHQFQQRARPQGHAKNHQKYPSSLSASQGPLQQHQRSHHHQQHKLMTGNTSRKVSPLQQQHQMFQSQGPSQQRPHSGSPRLSQSANFSGPYPQQASPRPLSQRSPKIDSQAQLASTLQKQHMQRSPPPPPSPAPLPLEEQQKQKQILGQSKINNFSFFQQGKSNSSTQQAQISPKVNSDFSTEVQDTSGLTQEENESTIPNKKKSYGELSTDTTTTSGSDKKPSAAKKGWNWFKERSSDKQLLSRSLTDPYSNNVALQKDDPLASRSFSDPKILSSVSTVASASSSGSSTPNHSRNRHGSVSINELDTTKETQQAEPVKEKENKNLITNFFKKKTHKSDKQVSSASNKSSSLDKKRQPRTPSPPLSDAQQQQQNFGAPEPTQQPTPPDTTDNNPLLSYSISNSSGNDTEDKRVQMNRNNRFQEQSAEDLHNNNQQEFVATSNRYSAGSTTSSSPPASPKDQKDLQISKINSDSGSLSQSTLKVESKSYERPNQPIKYTESAFGFPLPPPSHSTTVMLDYRFPIHAERAIYRLSHLKLANPKRPLRQQVLLSNFMYAYLNLVNHTLYLQQMSENGDGHNNNNDLSMNGEDFTEEELINNNHDHDDEDDEEEEDEFILNFEEVLNDNEAGLSGNEEVELPLQINESINKDSRNRHDQSVEIYYDA